MHCPNLLASSREQTPNPNECELVHVYTSTSVCFLELFGNAGSSSHVWGCTAQLLFGDRWTAAWGSAEASDRGHPSEQLSASSACEVGGHSTRLNISGGKSVTQRHLSNDVCERLHGVVSSPAHPGATPEPFTKGPLSRGRAWLIFMSESAFRCPVRICYNGSARFCSTLQMYNLNF